MSDDKKILEMPTQGSTREVYDQISETLDGVAQQILKIAQTRQVMQSVQRAGSNAMTRLEEAHMWIGTFLQAVDATDTEAAASKAFDNNNG